MDEITADKLVSAYIGLRNAIQKKEDEVTELKKKQESISQELLAICNEQNIDSLRTAYGTVIRKVQSSYWTNDWEKMYEFIKEHDALHLLHQRIHSTHMKEFLEENPGSVPPGLQADRMYIVSVRKPTSK